MSLRNSNPQEARFQQAMASFQAEMRYLQEQGLDVSNLHASAAEIAAVQAEQAQMAQMAQEQLAQARAAHVQQGQQAQQAQMAQMAQAQMVMEAQMAAPQAQTVEATGEAEGT